MNDLVGAGADYFVLWEKGRWTSISTNDYYHITRSSHFEWDKWASKFALDKLEYCNIHGG